MVSTKTVENYFQILTQNIPILDVRAEIEFQEGSIPGAVNRPILNVEERHLVGTEYKQQGKDAAVTLGHKIVSHENKDRKVQSWLEFFKKYPEGYLTCFRGGMRSQITQQWLAENNVFVPRLQFGYKGFRAWAIQQLEIETKTTHVRVVSGTTGSGKTLFLNDCKNKMAVIDLEKEANHRGSAFGSMGPQPSQADFEHQVLKEFLKIESKKNVLIEDESRLIGQRALPPGVFNMIRSSSILLIEEPIVSRVEHIFDNYINGPDQKLEVTLDRFIQSTMAISKKLGLERAQEIKADIQICRAMIPNLHHESDQKNFKYENFKWIEKLLVWYYDPMYLGSLQKRNPRIDFRGTRQELKEFLGC